MRAHAKYMWVCGALVVGALVAVIVTGSALYLLPAVGCVLMMGMMMWMMVGMARHGGRDGDGPSDHAAHHS